MLPGLSGYEVVKRLDDGNLEVTVPISIPSASAIVP
jgi:DNA-binding response OmpR family regulator